MCLCDITAWMPVGEGWIIWIGTIHWLRVLSPLESGKSLYFLSPLEGGKIRILSYLRVANRFKNKHEMFCSNLGDPVYTCMMCASHSNSRLITGIRTHVFSKIKYHVSKGRSLIGRAGVLMKWPSPIVPKFPSRGNFGDDGHVALGNESGFPKFFKIKYLGGDSVSGKAVHVWHYFQNLFSQNDLPDLDSLVQIKNRDNLRVLSCNDPNMNRTGLTLPGRSGTSTGTNEVAKE